MSTKHSKEGIARNDQYYKSFKRHEASLQEDLKSVQRIIAESISEGINEVTMEMLSNVFRGYEYIKPIYESAWERYENHCIDFDFEIKD